MTDATPLVLCARDESSSSIALLTINRPDKLNALNRGVLTALFDALTTLKREGGIRVAIVTGAGEKAFVAGADIGEMRAMSVPEAKAMSDLGHSVGELMQSLPFVIIAAVNGFALGGGTELAMACDLVYASEKAKFGQPEVNLGVIPGFGGTQRLARRVGVGKARELVYTGDIIDAVEAHRIGLCEAVVPHGTVVEYARAVAKKIAGKGPFAIAQAKVAMRRGDPQLAAANVNCRVLPEDAVDYVTSTLRGVFADTAVTMRIEGTPERGPASPLRADLMSAVSAVTTSLWPGVPTVPMMVMGATDGLYLRAAGIPTYGIQGFFYDRDDIRFHGRDERLKVQSFYEGQTFLYELVKRLTGAPSA